MAEARTYYEEAASKNPDNEQPEGQVAELRRQVSELARQIGDYASKAAGESVDRVDEAVHQNPYRTLGLAVLAGIGIGFILRR